MSDTLGRRLAASRKRLFNTNPDHQNATGYDYPLIVAKLEET